MSLLPTSNTTGIEKPADSLPVIDPTPTMTWQRQLATAIRNPDDLLQRLSLPSRDVISSNFTLLVPESFVRRMVPGDARDPLLRQVLTDTKELNVVDGFESDPVGDADAKMAAGVLQKYEGRALLVTNGACAVHCRYCFRREYPYQDEPRRLEDWQPAIESLVAAPGITEVILSGGDPLMLTDARLAQLCQQLDEIPHLQRIRIHTRLPIVLPARVTDELTQMLTGLRCQVVIVVHANHGNEIADDCVHSLKRLVAAGMPVLNQAVLLKGINDSADALTELCLRLVNIGVMPYYLHQLDRVTGSAHFEVTAERGAELIEQIRKNLPGYAVPRFVKEIKGQPNKTPIQK